MQRFALLAAGALTAGVLIIRRKRRQRSKRCHRTQHEGSSKQEWQIVHAYPAPASSAQADADSAAAQNGQNGASSKLSRSYAYSSLLLLVSLALAVCTVVLLALRGQADLALAAAVTWMLAAPAVLSLGKKRAVGAAADGSTGGSSSEVANDALMVITDAEPPTKILSQYHGTWIKDAAASDSMDPAMRLIHLNPVMRQAVKLIRGVQLGIEEERFRFAVFSAISWFKLSEYFPWNGEVVENRRRDMRRGKSKGQVGISAKGTILLTYTWDTPYAGIGHDEFSIDEAGRLRLSTSVNVGGEVVKYVQVYRRKRNSSSGGGAAAAGRH